MQAMIDAQRGKTTLAPTLRRENCTNSPEPDDFAMGNGDGPDEERDDLMQIHGTLPAGAMHRGEATGLCGASAGGRWFCADGLDLVNFGDFHGFMLVEDNLYKLCVDEAHKHVAIERHYEMLRQSGHRPSPVNQQNVAALDEAQWGIYVVLNHLIRRNIPVTFLDVGSFVGDVGLRYANYMRTIGYAGGVYCFDPSLSGELIPYNIRLNGLEPWMTYCPYAVSDMAGYITFLQRQGHSDSASTSLSGAAANTIVESIRLSDFIREKQIDSAFIKLDTENLESRILNDISEFLAGTVNAVGLEFHAHQREMYPVLEGLLQTHLLFDIGYLPKPFCFRPVTRQAMGAFIQETARRPYGYTDVLAVSRKTPDVEALAARLGGLKPSAVGYSLVYG
jgi:FkbM family methyltransferase